MKKKVIIIALLLVIIVFFFFDNMIAKASNFDFKNILDNSLYWGLFVIVISSLVLIFYKKLKKIPLLWISLFATAVITWLIKVIVQRPRPFEDLGIEVMRSGFSFPSGHATFAFAALPFLENNKVKWIGLVIISIIVLLRVYSGVHYLSDVIFGAILGYSISYLIIYLYKKKWKK